MHSTLFPTENEPLPSSPSTSRPLQRIWRWLLSGRIAIALLLVALLLMEWATQPRSNVPLLVIAVVYLIETVVIRLMDFLPPERGVGLHWVPTLGVDLMMVASLQWMHAGSYSFLPLLGLPVLMSSMLGSRLLGLSTASMATLLLLTWSAWEITLRGAPASAFLPAALSGTAYFCIVLLVQQLSSRLERERLAAERNRQAALLQRQVSRVVMEQLSDGVLVVDAGGVIRLANPVALQLMGLRADFPESLSLAQQGYWAPLYALARAAFRDGKAREANVSLVAEQRSPQALQVRTLLTPMLGTYGQMTSERLCVMFLHDLRLIEARLRTEKLAAMGRMSAAVAHEIRNPLAAIVQANALLQEDLQDPTQQRLAQMVRSNAERLARTAEEILDIARVQQQIAHAPTASLALDDSVRTIWQEWLAHDPGKRQGALHLGCQELLVEFDHEHLRRVMVNLLDNALRYCAPTPQAIQVLTSPTADRHQSHLTIWSDAPPIDQSVLRHLFEPFFSSESRSSGLGLYICRQLCERHGASIEYQRMSSPLGDADSAVQGNAFIVRFRPTSSPLPQTASLFDLPPV